MFNMVSPINVANITSKTGVIIDGPAASQLGQSVAAAGDVNGDGIADIIIGGPEANSNTGAAYVIYGGSNLTSPIATSSITSSTGLAVNGSGGSRFGHSVHAAGDINGDGIDDIIIGAPEANSAAGAAYVIYGGASLSSPITAASITSSTGLIINGSSGSRLGYSVSTAGDVNGDGITDIVVGAYSINNYSGTVYVIYGGRILNSPIIVSDITSSTGLIINGLSDSQFGWSVAAAGDVNGDGIDDIIVGAPAANSVAGAVYVIYGGASLSSPITAASITSSIGLIVNGPSNSQLGWSVGAGGDFNGDGIDDIIAGANWANSNAGASYIIYGSESLSSPIAAASITSSTGLIINGLSNSELGYSVSAAGDVNGDGLNDVITGSDKTNIAYVIYGGKKIISPIAISIITSSTGVVINGPEGSKLGVSVANAGDINYDGIEDVIIGANGVQNNAGAAYVIYGSFSQQSQQNYCMLSQVVKFVSINSQNSIGSISLGFNEQWCNSKSLFIGDFNGDGKKDLLCSLVNGESYVMLSQGTSFLPMGSDPDGRIKIGANDKWCSKDIQELHIGDFNNDKKSDLLCRVNVHEADEGSNYVMLSTGNSFEPMTTNTTDGAINIGKLGKFCFVGSRLVIGNFDGQGGDDLFCNNPTGGSIVNMLMVSNGTSFVSANANILGAVQMGQTDACQPVWCVEPGSKIMTGDFNGDGKADLLCNANGVNKIMLSMLPQSGSCDFKPISTDGNGTIAMGQGTWPLWCDTSKSTLVTADVDGDALSDLVCNDNGVNQIMLCKKISNNNYRFDSFNINNPKDLGNTSMAGHDKWCTSQSILAGDINGDTLDDIWCNQGGNVLG